METPSDIPAAFVEASRRYITRQYLPKIENCLEQLSDEEIWWRPNERSNSVGNLILHLNGNVRQYVISGVAGEPDIRERDREFAARGGATRSELLDVLTGTLEEVDRVLGSLHPDQLREERTIQGRSRSVFDAIYHVVEHFSTHVGQILYITKMLKDRDLGFYGFKDQGVEERWLRDQ